MKSPGSPRWRKAGRHAKGENPMPPSTKQVPADTSDLAGLTPEQIVKNAAPEAIATLVEIMRKPGRNAAAQMRAAETLIRYSVQEPAKATTIDQSITQRLEGDINIVLVPSKYGRRAE